MSQVPSYLASQLYARSQGYECKGPWRCHWCSAPCLDEFIHDDPPPVPFQRSTSTAKCPAEAYICVGCWAWRRPRTTISFLSGGYLDKQEAKGHSWLVTDKQAWALRLGDFLDMDALYTQLLQPPRYFFLALRLPNDKIDTLLQLAQANCYEGIHANTPLRFTVNNIVHQYTVYELGEAMKNGPPAYGPGISALYRALGEPSAEAKKQVVPLQAKEEPSKKTAGRPKPKDDARHTTKKVVLASGTPAAA